MNKRALVAGILFLMVGSFLVGAWISHRSTKPDATGGRRILHYVDPMHPSYTSDKPGIAPDCGMPLVPVYADGAQGTTGGAEPPGTVQLSPEQQQLIGVKVGEVENTGGSQSLRLQGRVAPDELRTFVINATIDGWITSVGKNTTGSIVRKNETLATFYSPEFLSAGQALLYALGSMDRSMNTTGASQAQKDQMQQFNVSLKQYRDALRNLGMGELQIAKMIKTREYMENVDVTSPGPGLVISRNISPGQRFERGKELYRITDLSRVWVFVDTYGAEVDHVKPGTVVRVSVPNRPQTFTGRVASVPPTFDPATRTLRVRVEVDNPGYVLRPDMFVDCELPVKLPAMLSVPNDAVLDSGLKKIVYVEKKTGIFEPREVETGSAYGGRVAITSGLKAGERIAISGTFLLDSESRMKTSAAGITSTPQLDPVCGMYVDEARAQAAGLTVESGGKTHYFCSKEDKDRYLKNPAAKKSMVPESTAPAKPAAKKQAVPPPMTDEHAGHDMPAAAPAPPTPAAPHSPGMKHD